MLVAIESKLLPVLQALQLYLSEANSQRSFNTGSELPLAVPVVWAVRGRIAC